MNESRDYYKNFLNSRFEDFRDNLNRLIRSFAAVKQNNLDESAKKMRASGQALLEAMAPNDVPNWLREITHSVNQYLSGTSSENAFSLLDTVIRNRALVKPIQIDNNATVFDFDDLFRRHAAEGKLPDLFDTMIKAISDMIESDVIDSNEVLRELQKLLRVLQSNRNGSFEARFAAIKSSNYVWHLVVGYVKKIPFANPWIEAYERAAEDAEKEIEKLQDEMRDEAISRILTTVEQQRLSQIVESTPAILDAKVIPKTADFPKLPPPEQEPLE